MTRLENSIRLHAPLSKVWKLITHERLPEWFDLFKSVELTSKEDNIIGSTHHMTSELYEIIRFEWDGEITEYEENKMYSWRSIRGPFSGFGSMILEPSESGTYFTMTLDYDVSHSYLGKLLDKIIIHKALESEFEEGLKELKALVEEG